MNAYDEPQTRTFWHLVGRPTAAYVMASVAAGCFVGLVVFPFISGRALPGVMIGSLAVGLMWSPAIAVVAALPSIAALVLVKVLDLPRGITDTLAGGLIGAVMITLILQTGSSSARPDGDVLIEAARFGAAGLVGGYVYWLTNGRPRSRRQIAANAQPLSLSTFD